MLTYFKRLLWDESAFIGLARGMLLALASVMTMNDGSLVVPQNSGQWTAAIFMAVGGYLRSSSSPAASPASARSGSDRPDPTGDRASTPPT